MISFEFTGICAIGISLLIAILYYVHKMGSIESGVKNVEEKIEKLETSKDLVTQRFAQLEGRFLIIEQLTLKNIGVKQRG